MKDAIAGLVLAGGASRRMGGGHKFLIELAGKTMLERAVERLRPQVGPLAISANCDPDMLPNTGLPVLPDAPPAGRGPLAGLLAGLNWAAAGDTSHVVTVASDTPFFPARLVAELAACRDGHPDMIVLAASAGRVHPVFGLWPVSLRAALRSWLDDGHNLKVTDFAGQQVWRRCDFAVGAGGDPFFNVNTPEELADARLRASGDNA